MLILKYPPAHRVPMGDATAPFSSFTDPGRDPELGEFRRVMGGSGWVAKIPHGSGLLFIHLREPAWHEQRELLKEMGGSSPGHLGLPDDASHPVDVAKFGLLLRATFVNNSSAPFIRDWSQSSRTYDLLVGMAQDLEEPWHILFDHRKLLRDSFPEKLRPLLHGRVEVPPGGRVEKLLRLRPDSMPEKRRVHGSHIQFITFTAVHDFGEGFMGRAPGPVPVPFPFFNPDAFPTNGRTEVDVRVDGDGGGFAAIPPHQVFRAGDEAWISTGITAIGPAGGRAAARVACLRTTPGPSISTAKGTPLRFRPAAAGFRYPLPFTATCAVAPAGGAEPQAVENWKPYSGWVEKAEAEARRAREEAERQALDALAEEERRAREEFARAEAAAWAALPFEEKLASLDGAGGPALATVLRRFGDLKDGRAVPSIERFLGSGEREVREAARSAFTALTGMTPEEYAAKRARDEYFIALARRYASVTNIEIRDSVLNRTHIDVGGGGGDVRITVADSVVTKSDLGPGGKKGEKDGR